MLTNLIPFPPWSWHTREQAKQNPVGSNSGESEDCRSSTEKPKKEWYL